MSSPGGKCTFLHAIIKCAPEVLNDIAEVTHPGIEDRVGYHRLLEESRDISLTSKQSIKGFCKTNYPYKPVYLHL